LFIDGSNERAANERTDAPVAEESETPMNPEHATKTAHPITFTNETETATMTTTTTIHPTIAASTSTATQASPATAATTPTPKAPGTALPYVKAPPADHAPPSPRAS
jgi:hypothetical protein